MTLTDRHLQELVNERHADYIAEDKKGNTMNTKLNNIDILLIKSEILLASDGKCAIDTETVYKLFEMFKQAQENLRQSI